MQWKKLGDQEHNTSIFFTIASKIKQQNIKKNHSNSKLLAHLALKIALVVF